MKHLGNLAFACARRSNTLLQILDGMATVYVGRGPDRESFTVDCYDDEKIHALVLELNHGRFREDIIKEGDKAA
jgi:hypothetical protein